jgi:hypothetical protein
MKISIFTTSTSELLKPQPNNTFGTRDSGQFTRSQDVCMQSLRAAVDFGA